MKSLYRKVESFDGQTITINGKPSYELGSFLGGGAAGVVYEGTDLSDKSQIRPVAIKILNPVGFRLAPAVTLRRCIVARRGQQVGGSSSSSGAGAAAAAASEGSSSGHSCGGAGGAAAVVSAGPGSPGSGGGGAGASRQPSKLGPEHVWWLVSPNTKQVLAAYMDPRYGSLVELPLPKCIEIWGLNPRTDAPPSSPPAAAAAATASSSACRSPNAEFSHHDCWNENGMMGGGGFDMDGGGDSPGGGLSGGSGGRGAFEVQVDGMGVSIPWLPPKYVQWLAQRRKVKREINNMGRVGGHSNVLQLLSVLELLQDSKSTLFLILELVTGGELLDHIRLAGEEGSRVAGSRAKAASALRAAGAAQRYFSQLLSGLAYCHRRGVCHRDLSPSNLLLAESPQGDAPPELKVADFGLSACCGGAFSSTGNENQGARSKERRGLPQRVRSVVGSPYYMAPEVTTGNSKGYDGFKADAWSCGVVLYTMLTQSLPFDRDLSRCPRYKRFKIWVEKHRIGSSQHTAAATTTTTALPRGSSSSSSSSSSSATPPSSSGVASEAALPQQASASPIPSPVPPSPCPTNPAQKHKPPHGSSVLRTSATPPPVPPAWLFPPMIPPAARDLLVSLLVPNPSRRMSVEQALSHPWLEGGWGSEAAGGGTPAAAAAATAARELRQPTLRRRCWRGREGAARQRTLMRKRRTPSPSANGPRRSLPRPPSRDLDGKK
ncbi:Serine/threonine protein kinase [Ectocarpus siliculosus]|uniref:non-specific serine/threonine protein kinase n=1 Tax=Ectocarpus siliculosus TaxID=2880 RepID=D8LHX7_ECTSI|nr:Serine/threonine protein kinase [Ectocarpus siliculosus]|eukprot:CBN74408.1 Serine/threonine protein kinase [Ectocarpus siliculosus]